MSTGQTSGLNCSRAPTSRSRSVAQAQRYIAAGYTVVVDLDLEKFFDQVTFGPSVLVSGLTYLLLRLSALECLTSLADGWT